MKKGELQRKKNTFFSQYQSFLLYPDKWKIHRHQINPVGVIPFNFGSSRSRIKKTQMKSDMKVSWKKLFNKKSLLELKKMKVCKLEWSRLPWIASWTFNSTHMIEYLAEEKIEDLIKHMMVYSHILLREDKKIKEADPGVAAWQEQEK